MEKFLREWRQDALNKAQYESAIFIGDKLLALTNDDNDAFWLAQVHFATGNYTRAQAFLSKQDLISRNPACRYLAGHCLIKQSRFDEALAVLGERNPTHLIPNGPSNKRKASAAVSRNGRSKRDDDAAAAAADGEVATRRFEAAMCFLRGICYAKQNAFDRAKDCYKDAVRIDVQCFEAFQQLMRNSLLSPDEEWQFLESLNFDSIHIPGDPSASAEAADFTKMLYTTRLSKYRNPAEFETAYESLSTHYRLAANPDLQLARADLLYTQCRYRDALAITNAVLEDDRYNFAMYPIHLACLYELKMKNLLFLIAHDLADHHPDEPCTWLAVGIYYFAIDKIAEARRYFSKASMMDAHFGPAWIGFAHTFAAEGEHDQAISAYSTAARLFMGTHLPQIFLGMQNHALNNMAVAEEFLKTAYGLCTKDPLLLNEMGIVKYHQNRPKEAVRFFLEALKVADENESEPTAWLAARTNLGHAFRRMRSFTEALAEFDEVLRVGGKDAAIFSAKGLILMELNRPEEAVTVLHEALAIAPQDSIATELLNKALDETVLVDFAGEHEADDLADFESFLDQKKSEAGRKVNPGNGNAGGAGGSSSSTTTTTKSSSRGAAEKGKARVRRRRAMMPTDEDDQNAGPSSTAAGSGAGPANSRVGRGSRLDFVRDGSGGF
ncbi:Anaphase-promoting complex subunit cut9 [Escovopsis weberi]|uniref:Anaphase-promoting complex subunit cut9 n=1 Tax=Escovopsis weberi TaxID=150374 RepID=A0A0M8N362_ESCWE|nr:Anaphase-promoting complex subunit cut9 [Escovopsis weberi]